MNAPEKITSAEPINAAHEVLMKAADAMCTQQIASEIHGRPRPTKPQIKAVEKWLKEVHDRGMLTSQPGRGGAALYSLTTPVCDLVQTRGESQTAAPAERVLTPEAEAEREDFEAKYGMLGNCSCHISPPCGSCIHPGNPRNQEEDETAWMAAGDSEGGETDAPAARIPAPEYDPASVAFPADFASDPALQYLAPEDYEMPPADPKLLAMANRALHDQAEELRAQLSSIAMIAAAYLPDPSDISTARAVEIMDMLADAQTGHILAQESALETRIQAWVKERGDISHVLEEIVFEPFTTSLLDHAKTAANAFSALSAKHETLKHQITELRTRAAEQAAQYQADIARISSGLAAERQAMNNAINEADRLRSELATARVLIKAMQERGNVKDVAVGYLVRVPRRPPIIRRKLEAARLAALGAVRAGAARADVLAVVPVGAARRGAEWREA